MCRVTDMGSDERRERCHVPWLLRLCSESTWSTYFYVPWELRRWILPQGESWLTSPCQTEFAGTLLGFDDYVSKYTSERRTTIQLDSRVTDMVLEDVTEL